MDTDRWVEELAERLAVAWEKDMAQPPLDHHATVLIVERVLHEAGLPELIAAGRMSIQYHCQGESQCSCKGCDAMRAVLQAVEKGVRG